MEDTLLEQLVDAIPASPRERAELSRAEMASIVLCALGLGDVDAAVERAQVAWWEGFETDGMVFGERGHELRLVLMRRALEAAFTCSATEGPDDA